MEQALAHTKFHLGYFTKFGPPAWRAESDRTHGDDWWTGQHFAKLGRRLEKSFFDFMFFEDSVNVSRVYQNSMDADLKFAIYTPKHDPLQLLPYLAGQTERIGLIGTASTSFYPPYLLARALSTADSLSSGRVGWNMVTSSERDAARNFGMDALPSPIERYDRADEFVELAKALWDSWEEGSLVIDQETNTYIDPSKVHAIDYVGKYHRSRGPLNTLRSPQGRPVLAQAGASDRGRDFAAKHADAVFALTGSGIEEMKALRSDLRARAKSHGRNPDDLKIFWATPAYITQGGGPVDRSFSDSEFVRIVAWWSTFFDLDLSNYDLDNPMPEGVTAMGHTSMMNQLQTWGRDMGVTLRQGLTMMAQGSDEIGIAGPAEKVAANLVAAMDEVGGDGIMILSNDVGNERFVSSIVDELVPELQRLGVVRTSYSGATLRENLRAF
ncbi:NtaA/DmoA family FMN-dependent monooxygenase [Microbacterium sp. A8/3-1]|uniref:NtaA/DmoA family FMN-dependent monooxygenase n=1 Tax=Microbacterium sp. A8/3-1 TaxID=3160749 RepID=A0AAU7W1I4_9MICO